MKRLAGILIIILTLVITGFLAYKLLLKAYYPTDYSEQVARVARENDISEGLIFAIIHTESGFDPYAESEIGARGLMQITEDTFEWVKLRMNDEKTQYVDLYDPEINIQYGGWLLALLREEYESYDNVIYAYHAGWGSVGRWLKDAEYTNDGSLLHRVPYTDTEHYKYKVSKAWERYKELYDLD